MDKPVELMTDEERQAYYAARHEALLIGDDGILPSGKTCKEEREEYIAFCLAASQSAVVAPESEKKTGRPLKDAVKG